MNIYLIRHGQSEGNVDRSIHHTFADHAIPLSKNGHKQALECGKFLNEYSYGGDLRLWVSPYLRTRQTADEIEKNKSFSFGRREHINLVEQQFGLFDGLEDEELKSKYPEEFAHYKKCEDQAGRFWARMPLGESRFDVAVRVHDAFGTFIRDKEKSDVNDIVIVSHGATIRAFIMQWLHLPFEWFEKEPNPPNCSIRLLKDNQDCGYIFKGFNGQE